MPLAVAGGETDIVKGAFGKALQITLCRTVNPAAILDPTNGPDDW